jgi:hypothetical protein
MLYAHWKVNPYTYLAELNRYEWTGNGDMAFSVLSKPGSETKDVHGASYWYGAIGINSFSGSSALNISLTPATVTYDIDQQYQILTADWGAISAADPDYIFWVEIYGDNKLLYTTPEQQKGSAAKSFSVDVTGIKYLKLSIKCNHLIFSNGTFLSGGRGIKFALFNPTLYR